MNHHHLHQLGTLMFLLLPLFFSYVEAQSQSPPSQENSSAQDVVTNFQPSLAVVIGILALMFSLTFVLLVYAKFCHRSISLNNSNNNQSTLDGLLRSGPRFSGIDKTVIESLPFFRFSSLRGSKEGLECAVCLSKFEDIEILRLLPKCKHAFHIHCVDEWLEKHSSCPLCRHKVSSDDLSLLTYSNSLRFLWGSRSNSELRGQDSNLELFVQREAEDRHGSSSRFSVGNSFRRIEKGKNKEEELPIQEFSGDDDEQGQKMLHKLNHRIVVFDFVLKNRWSNVTSSDLMFLNSEMISSESSDRFSALGAHKDVSPEVEDGGILKIKEEIDRKRDFEGKVSKMSPNHPFQFKNGPPKVANQSKSTPSHHQLPRVSKNVDDKRSLSEIIVHPRFREFDLNNSVVESSHNGRWLPIARRTVQWFANREKSQQSQKMVQSLNV